MRPRSLSYAANRFKINKSRKPTGRRDRLRNNGKRSAKIDPYGVEWHNKIFEINMSHSK